MAARRTACLHVSRAMQAARRREDFDFPRRLGRRAEAGPRQVLPRVGRQSAMLEPIGPIARLFVFCLDCGDYNRIVFHKIDERKWELWKNVSPRAGDVLRPAMRCFGYDCNRVVELAKKRCLGYLAAFSI